MATLFLVGTPIGNLSDMTFRAVETLKNVDVIACEDTRHSIGLLNYYEIKKPLIACHKFNERESIDKISELLSSGKDVALITDAGMPAISDPGAILVDGIRNRGYNIVVIPGPTALTSAIALSGILQPVFTFIGFLPTKNKDKDEIVSQFIDTQTNLVFYSSPYDINKDCNYLFKALGERDLYIVKEITKIHESCVKTKLSEVNIDNPKGEFVLIVAPGEKVEKPIIGTIKEQLVSLINSGIDKKEAIKQIAKLNKLSKDEVYKEAMNI